MFILVKNKDGFKYMVFLFISRHDLANVNDKKVSCIAEEGSLFQDTAVISINNHASPLEICNQSGLHS